MLSELYGRVTRARRRWFTRHPGAQRRLVRPVISVGNLTVGGSGKTPLVAYLARRLSEAGERPAVLSRGYGRRRSRAGVVVVRDADRMRAGLDEAGDEPLMLARSLDGVAVLVSPNRYAAGRLAEEQMGCTVHILDDGFQHLALARDVDLIVAAAVDLTGAQPLPAGRLREPLDAAAAADAIVVTDASAEDAAALAGGLAVARGFAGVRRQRPARLLDAIGERPAPPGLRAFAVAGIARPERFLDDLRAAGWRLAGELRFRDHHAYRPRDIRRIVSAARAADADLILTTEKDLVRLLPYVPLDIPLAWVPFEISVEPGPAFSDWLRGRLEGAKESRA